MGVCPATGGKGGVVAAMDGWFGGGADAVGIRPAPVVMANEAHSGLARCIRTRNIGVGMIGSAHQAGVRRRIRASPVVTII
jgi:hypothetical protein